MSEITGRPRVAFLNASTSININLRVAWKRLASSSLASLSSPSLSLTENALPIRVRLPRDVLSLSLSLSLSRDSIAHDGSGRENAKGRSRGANSRTLGDYISRVVIRERCIDNFLALSPPQSCWATRESVIRDKDARVSRNPADCPRRDSVASSYRGRHRTVRFSRAGQAPPNDSRVTGPSYDSTLRFRGRSGQLRRIYYGLLGGILWQRD